MSIHHSFGTVFSSINTRFSHACRKSSWICWWPLLPGFCFQPVGKKMGPKNVAMFFVGWYSYDKPEAKIIRSYFLSKPASLSERNHWKLKWNLKMPPPSFLKNGPRMTITIPGATEWGIEVLVFPPLGVNGAPCGCHLALVGRFARQKEMLLDIEQIRFMVPCYFFWKMQMFKTLG